MVAHLARRMTQVLGVLLMPLALTSCVLTPGKFVSTLRIDADRHFTFTYVGEVIDLDFGDELTKGMKDDGDTTPTEPTAAGDDEPTLQKIAKQKAAPNASADDAGNKDTGDKDAKTEKEAKERRDAKNRALAATIAKEAGYRSVTYLGDGKFNIDYAISGTLDRGFIWPYNLDAEIMFPFVALEVRANNTVRIKAPGYANQSDKGMAAGMNDKSARSLLDGSFTLDTDAEIVSQNQEDGVTMKGPRKVITWKATPNSKEPPTAVLRFK